MKTRDHLHTMASAYTEICRGEDPWIALGDFMNDWFDYAKDRRERLVADPLVVPDVLSDDKQHWAVFCAASIEWLCQQYGVACPAWVFAPVYYLSDPWFYYPQAKLRERLIQQTPEPFTRRNIYCGNRMFLNKYELTQHSSESEATA
jgi:hypothetical protein